MLLCRGGRWACPSSASSWRPNRNDILARFFETGRYRKGTVQRTLSPSMDIQVASNFERLLADLSGRDGGAVRSLMAQLAEHGAFTLKGARLAAAQAVFAAARADDEACLATIADVWRTSGRMIDPHSAAGVHAARQLGSGGAPVVSLATAHPAKFPDAIEQAVGIRPAMPPRLAALASKPERVTELPADAALLTRFIRDRVHAPQRERVA